MISVRLSIPCINIGVRIELTTDLIGLGESFPIKALNLRSILKNDRNTYYSHQTLEKAR